MAENKGLGGKTEDLYTGPSRRHGFAVLNAEEKDPEVEEFEADDDKGEITIEELKGIDYEVPVELRGYTIKPRYKIEHKVGDKAGKFDGMFVCVEYQGMPHPLLLMPAEKITQKKH